ncbi:hypothetical protein HPP92_028325 [Vanilla planifolia]|uniref:Uncharacterized protein n=1 Tax=Vanilla planifolia TaxID=51239 RepID=A0A835P630_VANPL|nr:hypothetical protein HPP92_028325 [Vanilla planifolia]
MADLVTKMEEERREVALFAERYPVSRFLPWSDSDAELAQYPELVSKATRLPTVFSHSHCFLHPSSRQEDLQESSSPDASWVTEVWGYAADSQPAADSPYIKEWQAEIETESIEVPQKVKQIMRTSVNPEEKIAESCVEVGRQNWSDPSKRNFSAVGVALGEIGKCSIGTKWMPGKRDAVTSAVKLQLMQYPQEEEYEKGIT